MSNLFINENDVFEVTIFVATMGKEIYCENTKEELKILLGKDYEKYDIEEYKIIFKMPALKQIREIYSSINVNLQAPENGVNFNIMDYKEKKFKSLIKEWNLNENKEMKTPLNSEIEQLNPKIFNIISQRLEVETGGDLT